MALPKISVLIAVNDHPALDDVLDALSKQTVCKSEFEIIIAPTKFASHDVIAEIEPLARKLAMDNVVIVDRTESGRASANNSCLKNSRASTIVFLADDMVPAPEFLAQHIKFHQDNAALTAIGIGPAVFLPELRSDPFLRWMDDSGSLFGISFTKAPVNLPEEFFYVANASIKRDLVDIVGFFDERFPTDAWEDFDYGIRLNRYGAHSHFLDKAVCYHEHLVELEERRDALKRAGQAALLIERLHPGCHNWRQKAFGSDWSDKFDELISWLKYRVNNTNENRECYYKTTMNLAFTRGYRNERSRVLRKFG